MEPLNSAALPPGGLRQDHHGFERVPLQPADSLPYHAYLEAADPTVNTTAMGLIQLQVAPDNSSVVRPHISAPHMLPCQNPAFQGRLCVAKCKCDVSD